ncbi:unnamed protein product, partial [Prorocentrum cordatum]
ANSGNGEKPAEPRAYLRVWETVLKSFLNACGRGEFDVTPPREPWGSCKVEQKTGAIYATELASDSDERRGVGIDRRLQSRMQFCDYLKGQEERRKGGVDQLWSSVAENAQTVDVDDFNERAKTAWEHIDPGK